MLLARVIRLGAGRARKGSRGVAADQEVLINYGRDFWKERKTEESSAIRELVLKCM